MALEGWVGSLGSVIGLVVLYNSSSLVRTSKTELHRRCGMKRSVYPDVRGTKRELFREPVKRESSNEVCFRNGEADSTLQFIVDKFY